MLHLVRLLGFAGFLVFCAFIACGGQPQSTVKAKDASAEFACADFLRLMEDMQKGILTDEEIREKVKAIRSNTRLSPSKSIQDAGDGLLRSVTVGNLADVQESFRVMTEACKQR